MQAGASTPPPAFADSGPILPGLQGRRSRPARPDDVVYRDNGVGSGEQTPSGHVCMQGPPMSVQRWLESRLSTRKVGLWPASGHICTIKGRFACKYDLRDALTTRQRRRGPRWSPPASSPSCWWWLPTSGGRVRSGASLRSDDAPDRTRSPLHRATATQKPGPHFTF